MAPPTSPLAHQDGPLYRELRPPTERDALERFLDLYRDEVLRGVEALADEEAAAEVLAATHLTVGGIVKHLAWSEDSWFQGKLLGIDVPEPWASAPLVDDPDWPFHSSRAESVAELSSLYAAACERSRAAASSCSSLDTEAARPSFGSGPVNLRWLYVHMIDETARHAGHMDLLIDAIEAAR